MVKQEFILPDESCPNCGNNVKVLSSAEEKGYFCDGDLVECVECGERGYISVDFEEGYDGVNWFRF